MWVVLPSTLSSELKRRDVPNGTEEGRKGRMATWGERRRAVGHLASNGLQSGAMADFESLFCRPERCKLSWLADNRAAIAIEEELNVRSVADYSWDRTVTHASSDRKAAMELNRS